LGMTPKMRSFVNGADVEGLESLFDGARDSGGVGCWARANPAAK